MRLSQPKCANEYTSAQKSAVTRKIERSLDVIAKQHHDKLGVDLWIAGPDAAEPINLQRKIIKGTAYKNWRLDGEFIYNPEDGPERFNVLEAGDIAIFGFAGELSPDTINLILVGKSTPQDVSLFQGLNEMLGDRSMTALGSDTLGEMCHLQGVPQSHPVWSVVEDEDLAEAAAGQAPAMERVLQRTNPPNMSLIELQAKKRENERIGRLGEELVDVRLSGLLKARAITGYTWVSDSYVISPYDFLVERAGSTVKLEVKTTKADFSREFHLSKAQLLEMVHKKEPYMIGRVYWATPEGAKMRNSNQLREYGRSILNALTSLPEGVEADGVTIRPDEAMFDREFALAGPAEPAE